MGRRIHQHDIEFGILYVAMPSGCLSRVGLGLTLQTVFYAYQGLRRRRAADASWASDSLYYSLAVVGLCSAFFHGLVKFYAQLGESYRSLRARDAVN
jgi:hypothetical protein